MEINGKTSAATAASITPTTTASTGNAPLILPSTLRRPCFECPKLQRQHPVAERSQLFELLGIKEIARLTLKCMYTTISVVIQNVINTIFLSKGTQSN